MSLHSAPSAPGASLDLLDQTFQADPYPTYAALRSGPSVVHVPEGEGHNGYWALTRFDDVWDAVRDPATFSSASGLTFFPDEIGQLGLPPTIVMLDPPRHTQLRGLIGRGFTPKRVAALEDDIRTYARSLLDGLVDLHRDFATKIPTFVVAKLLAVPEADWPLFDPWVSALTRVQNAGFDPGALGADTAVTEMFGYFDGLIKARRANPGDDLISALIAAELDGERLTDWDIMGFCFVMVAGGNDTTGALISHSVCLLQDNPEQRAELLADLSLLQTAIPEFLRLESSVQTLGRTTTREVEIHGQVIPAGEKVMMLYGCANRDEDEYGPNADELDIRREFTRMLAFSSGPHFCIGSHLAKLQARVALEELLTRYPQVRSDVTNGQRHLSPFTRGWQTLPALL